MRSSADILNSIETEPLLEGFEADIEEESVEVVVEPAPRKLPPSLLAQVEEYIRILEEIEAAVNTQHQPRINKYRLYTSIFLMYAVTAITAPTLLITLLKDVMVTPYDVYFHDELEHIKELNAKLDAANQHYGALQEEKRGYVSQFLAYLQPYYERWRAYDDEDSNCHKTHDPNRALFESESIAEYMSSFVYNALCIWKDQLPYHPGLPARCAEIAEEGCNEVNRHLELQKKIEALKPEIHEALEQVNLRRDDVANAKMPILAVPFSDRVNFPVAGAVFGVALLAVIGLVIAAKKYRDTHVGHKVYMSDKYNANQCMPELSHSEDLLKLLARLGIEFKEDMMIQALIAQLKAKAVELKDVRDRRVAFASGAHVNNSATHLYQFFHARGSRDLLKIILSEADLGDRYQPRPV